METQAAWFAFVNFVAVNVRKHPKYDLDNKRGYLLQIGLLIALILTLTAFEWKSGTREDAFLPEPNNPLVPDEVIPVTYQEKPRPELMPQQMRRQTPSPIIDIVQELIHDTEVSPDDIAGQDSAGIDENINGIDQVETGERDPEIYTLLDEPPAFPGGEELRMKFLQRTTIYPRFARENKVQGTVYVTFIVEADGRLSNIKILQGIGSGCDEETYRVVTAMPRWIPARKNQVAVRTQVTMPVTFTLQASQ